MRGKIDYWQTLIQELGQLKGIRAFISNSPGKGDQIIALHVIQKLRIYLPDLFIDIVYENVEVAKVHDLLGLKDKLNINQPLFLDKNTRVISLSYFLKKYDSQPLAEIGFGNILVLNKHLVDYANIFKNKIFLFFNPFYEPEITSASTTYQVLGNNHVIRVKRLASALRYPIPNLQDALDFLEKNLHLKNHDALKTLVTKIYNKQLRTFPIYGIDPLFKYLNPFLVIFNLIMAVQYAQEKTGEKQSVIFLLLNDLTREDLNSIENYSLNNTIPTLLNGTGSDLFQKRLEFYQTKARLTYIALTDPDFQHKLSQLKSGDVGVINIGSIPFTLFEALFSDLSSYPPVREGANSETLMYNAQRPFLHCPRNSYSPKNSDLDRLLYQVGKDICGPLSQWNKYPPPDQNIGQMLVNLTNSTSEVSKLFKNAFDDYHRVENDSIFETFKLALSVINGQTHSSFNKTQIPFEFFEGSSKTNLFDELLGLLFNFKKENCPYILWGLFLFNRLKETEHLLKNGHCSLNATIGLSRRGNDPVIFFAANPELMKLLISHMDGATCQLITHHENLSSWLNLLEHYGHDPASICKIAQKCKVDDHLAFNQHQCSSSTKFTESESITEQNSHLHGFAMGIIHGFFTRLNNGPNQKGKFNSINILEIFTWLTVGYITNTFHQQLVLINLNFICQMTTTAKTIRNSLSTLLFMYRLYSQTTTTLIEWVLGSIGLYYGWKIGDRVEKYVNQCFFSAPKKDKQTRANETSHWRALGSWHWGQVSTINNYISIK